MLRPEGKETNERERGEDEEREEIRGKGGEREWVKERRIKQSGEGMCVWQRDQTAKGRKSKCAGQPTNHRSAGTTDSCTISLSLQHCARHSTLFSLTLLLWLSYSLVPQPTHSPEGERRAYAE
ncbi:hypothetical protein niasHT_003123 [Heterodera trifolii]|uniref:Uncharacterized protein n=1 Tax=Heterodera trifolii TaxID=157864 RepID=A0ABD2M4X6_9BILA